LNRFISSEFNRRDNQPAKQEQQTVDIILASGSPRRRKLLRQINLTFEVEASGSSERYDPNDRPQDIVVELALRKARKVGEDRKDTLTIGADTVVVLDGVILEKPATRQEAADILGRLSGNTHEVVTGVALVKTGTRGNIIDSCTFFEVTKVSFAELDEMEINSYIDTGSPMDKAGAYGIQDDHGAVFVNKIEGDYYNVVGFPLHSFYTTLKQFAPEVIRSGLINTNP